MNSIRFKSLHPLALIPNRQREGDAGFDLHSCESGVVRPSDQRIVDTGIAVAIPDGHVGLIRDRSGLAAKKYITVMGGVIDSNYRGELKVILRNHDIDAVYFFRKGDRIAQLVIVPLCTLPVEVVAHFNDDTPRGNAGFGSSGR